MFLPAWDASVRNAARQAPLARTFAEPAAEPSRFSIRVVKRFLYGCVLSTLFVTDATTFDIISPWYLSAIRYSHSQGLYLQTLA